MPFRKKVRIYFDQGDPANIAFHGQHTIIAQRVMEEFICQIGIPWKDWYRSHELFIPVVRYDIHFKKPLIPGDEYFVDVQLARVGESSLTIDYNILNLKEVLCCSILAVYVCVSAKKWKSRPFPKEWKALLTKAMQNPPSSL